MPHLTQHDVMTMFLALATLLGTAKLAGELMQKLGQPSVLGEIFAGILLGPTVLGHFRPQLYAALFPNTGSMPIVIETVTTIGVVFFLLTAGLEIDLRSIFRQGKAALLVSFFGVIVPFAFGFAAAGAFPKFLGAEAGASRLIFALFVGTALSISALPVIAKILMDLNLLRTEMGTVVMSSAMFDDLVGWILFSMILGMMNASAHSLEGVKRTVLLVGAFTLLALTVVRWLIDKMLPFIQAHTSWPGGVLGFIFTLTLAGAAFAEFAGIHAVFGAFITGIAIGESAHLRKRTSEHIHSIVTNVFAPFFFASIGLRTNFVSNFNLGLTVTIIGVACLGKLLGAGWGARLGGMDRRTSWGVGLAMNARGAMEMILGLLALQAGLIRETMFVALVVMALFTSLVSAPAIHFLLRRRQTLTLKDTVTAKLFLPDMKFRTKSEALQHMSEIAADAVNNAPERFLRLVLERERVVPSGWENALAVPHARVEGLTQPIVVIAKSEGGIDFNARDGKLSRLIILILTGDNQSQHDLLGDAEEMFSRKEAIDQVLESATFVELVAALNAPVK
ncbi:MAG TPA: cation:proton antiporter [Candidatus Acidoferrales bacterium]|jgi:Kef-type K+ transport system membrane component KefB/mannitol/fructose-specific phosphotransferase system IIA component (Ntr-type)|nr:cation:proton antiporter [Candidatus Acidoferrales bacterium]